MRLRKSVLCFALATGVLAGCHKSPAPTAPHPPVAPTPPPPAPSPATEAAPAPDEDEYEALRATDVDAINRMGLLPDIQFDFDSAVIRDAGEKVLVSIAQVLKRFDFLIVTVEGHCDERGTVEYNLALGGRRAAASREYLVSLGVPAERLATASYGKEAPLCPEHSEECWARNRRAHFTVTGKNATP